MYVLPKSDQCREDFEWIRSEIVALGGEATVFVAEAPDPCHEELVVTFKRARDSDYQALKRDADGMLAASRAKRRSPVAHRDEWGRAVRRMRERFDEIERIDFFHAPAGQDADRAIGGLERLAASPKEPAVAVLPVLAPAPFRNRRWVTRPRPGVDRMASAWLIRRFVDPKAIFGFVGRPADGDVPFDMYTGQFSHHGTSCTFETLAQRFNITDPAVARIGQIVHDLDMKERRYATPEAPAVARMVDGLQDLHREDDTLLEHGMGMFEALSRSFSATEAATGRAASARKRKTRKRKKGRGQ